MKEFVKSRARVLTMGAAVLLISVIVLPVFGNGADADRLRITDDIQAFLHDGDSDQNLTFGNKGCELNPLTGHLVDISSNKGQGVKNPGIAGNGLGVKSGGANGTPCSQVSEPERLTITSDNNWDRLELDIEAKGNAWIHVELSSGSDTVAHHQLLTGSSIAAYNAANNQNETPAPGFPYKATTSDLDLIEACANPSDSGPDSGPNDNCRWTILSNASFDTVTIWASVGSVSLNGGGDFEGMPGFEDGAFDSLFFRTNSPPVGNDDSYTTKERNRSGGLLLDVTAEDGVLANDTDPNGDALTASDATTPTNGGSVTLNSDGSFSYTPGTSYMWDDDEFSREDTWSYTVSDGTDTDTATVTMTILRVICSDETVDDTDDEIYGSFTLLTETDECKHYEVDAEQGDEETRSSVTFTPDGNGFEAQFRGILSFEPQDLVDGSFSIGVEYDPDNEGSEEPRTLLTCINTVYDADGLVIAATLPTDETWCLAGVVSITVGPDGEIHSDIQVYGEEDPAFYFK